jgi:hypothetical protein
VYAVMSGLQSWQYTWTPRAQLPGSGYHRTAALIAHVKQILHHRADHVHLADGDSASGRGAVCGAHWYDTGVCQESGHLLPALQGTYAGLPDFLTQVVESELARIPRAFARSHPDLRWSIVYLPQVCCLLDGVICC